MAARNPTITTRKPTRKSQRPGPGAAATLTLPTPPRRHIYVLMYSERSLPHTTPLPYSPQIIAFSPAIALTPTDFTLTWPLTPPSATSTQKIEIVTLSNRANRPETLTFLFNAAYDAPDEHEPGGKQKVWICGWCESAAEAGWMVEESIRREEIEVAGEKGLSTLQEEWVWSRGPSGWFDKAVFKTDTGSVLQYDVVRVEVRE